MLTILRAVQSLMLHAEVLCAGPLIIAHQFEPVDIVSGDFVDYFLMDNGDMGFYVGDVSGKGLPAAMYVARPGGRNFAQRAQYRPVTR